MGCISTKVGALKRCDPQLFNSAAFNPDGAIIVDKKKHFMWGTIMASHITIHRGTTHLGQA